jgi:hypothetical protein
MTTTPFQDLLDSDTALVLDDPSGPAEDVLLVDTEGGEHPLRALYEAPGLDVTPGQAPVSSTAPLLHIPLSRVTAAIGRPLSKRDRLLVRGRRYRMEHSRPDGYGLLIVKLLEAGDA